MKTVNYTSAQLKAAKAGGFKRKKPTWKTESGNRRTKTGYIKAQNAYAEAVLKAVSAGKEKAKKTKEISDALVKLEKNGK